MIICLYYSNYPAEKTGYPNWENLPIGYLQINGNTFESEKIKKSPTLKGKFIFNQGRPRVGEHLLSVFSLNGKNYLYNSTFSYSHDIEKNPNSRDNFDANLGLHDIIKEWEVENRGF